MSPSVSSQLALQLLNPKLTFVQKNPMKHTAYVLVFLVQLLSYYISSQRSSLRIEKFPFGLILTNITLHRKSNKVQAACFFLFIPFHLPVALSFVLSLALYYGQLVPALV